MEATSLHLERGDATACGLDLDEVRWKTETPSWVTCDACKEAMHHPPALHVVPDEPEDGDPEEAETVEEASPTPEAAEASAPAPTSRTRRRPSVRSFLPRAVTLKKATRDELRAGAVLYPTPEGYERPRTRGDCIGDGENAARPCPWVSCKHHLYLDVNPETGTIKLNFPSLEVDEIPETCARDVADRGGQNLEQVGLVANVTRERVRQVEVVGLLRLKMSGQFDEDEVSAKRKRHGSTSYAQILRLLDEGLTVAEVAAALGVPPARIYNARHHEKTKGRKARRAPEALKETGDA